jgi:hypothetical protein
MRARLSEREKIKPSSEASTVSQLQVYQYRHCRSATCCIGSVRPTSWSDGPNLLPVFALERRVKTNRGAV